MQRPLREWSAPGFEVDADRPVPAGIDGEALMLDPPLRFRIRPGVLRVRIARKHPGASPSAKAPEGVWAGVVELARIARGRPQQPRNVSNKEARMDLMEITEKERLSRRGRRSPACTLPADAPAMLRTRPEFVPSDSATRCAASHAGWSTSAEGQPSYAGRSRS